MKTPKEKKTLLQKLEAQNEYILTDEHKKCLSVLEDSNDNLFITGKAGTGKSMLVQQFRNYSRKNVVVLAPTGIAALNVRGQTIHSFFGFRRGLSSRGQLKRFGKAGWWRKSMLS